MIEITYAVWGTCAFALKMHVHAFAFKMQLDFVYFINWYLLNFKEFKFYVENHKLPGNIQAVNIRSV